MDANDNELAYLEAIHFFVEVLDSFFGNVCELDLVFNFYKVGPFLSQHCSTVSTLVDCGKVPTHGRWTYTDMIKRSMLSSMKSSWQERLKKLANKWSCLVWNI